MLRQGIVFVRDPIIALDIGEIITSLLDPIQLYFPSLAADVIGLGKSSMFILTDRSGADQLQPSAASCNVPHIYLGVDVDTSLAMSFAHLKEPFTNVTVTETFQSLGFGDLIQLRTKEP